MLNLPTVRQVRDDITVVRSFPYNGINEQEANCLNQNKGTKKLTELTDH